MALRTRRAQQPPRGGSFGSPLVFPALVLPNGSADGGAAPDGAAPQAGGPQAPDQLAAAHLGGAQLHRPGPVLLGQVVVVALEDVAGHAQLAGEGVELVVGGVADQVAPAPAPPRPQGIIDQDHRAMVPVLELVAARYDEPHRRYHDRRHLEAVLACVERLLPAVAVPDPDAVRLAALFHDAVYDPRSASNEADSAALAGRTLAGLEPRGRVEAVQRLVLATAGHQSAAADEAVLVDADLAVLGAARPAYVAYARAVRQEYAHVPDEAWRLGRSEALRSLLGLPRLFTTPPMQAGEARARANLGFELASLA